MTKVMTLVMAKVWLMANKHMERYLTSRVIRKPQIKTTRYHYVPIRMAKIQNTGNTKCWQDEQKELLFIADENAEWSRVCSFL